MINISILIKNDVNLVLFFYKLKEKIINYQSKGTTFIIASHDHEFLKSIATKHLIVNDGRVSEL